MADLNKIKIEKHQIIIEPHNKKRILISLVLFSLTGFFMDPEIPKLPIGILIITLILTVIYRKKLVLDLRSKRYKLKKGFPFFDKVYQGGFNDIRGIEYRLVRRSRRKKLRLVYVVFLDIENPIMGAVTIPIVNFQNKKKMIRFSRKLARKLETTFYTESEKFNKLLKESQSVKSVKMRDTLTCKASLAFSIILFLLLLVVGFFLLLTDSAMFVYLLFVFIFILILLLALIFRVVKFADKDVKILKK